MNRPAQTVLIVDDDKDTRQILAAYAVELGLVPDQAENGVSALTRARSTAPDLILLDVEMPVMNGADTLVWLRQDRHLRDIPVIMVSGVNDDAIALRCIEHGAEDFIHKPIDFTLLRARMKSSLERARLRRMEREYQRQLEAHGLELEERVRQKVRELAEAHERLSILDRAKDDFLRLISHELRTPITGLVGTAEALAETDLDADMRNLAAQLLGQAVARLARIVEDAFLLTSIRVATDAFSLEERPLRPLVEETVRRAEAALPGCRVDLDRTFDEAGSVRCEPRLLGEALTSLIECAGKFSAPGEPVRVRCERTEEEVRVVFQVTGQGIPAAAIPKFFEIFALGAEPLTPGGDLGLGPPVAAQVLRLFGGSVAVEPAEDGVTFVVTLRPGPPAAHVCAPP